MRGDGIMYFFFLKSRVISLFISLRTRLWSKLQMVVKQKKVVYWQSPVPSVFVTPVNICDWMKDLLCGISWPATFIVVMRITLLTISHTCILHLTNPGRVCHNIKKSVWEIYSNLFSEEENVLLTLCYCCLLVDLRLLILCLFLCFALEKKVAAGWALKHILRSSFTK